MTDARLQEKALAAIVKAAVVAGRPVTIQPDGTVLFNTQAPDPRGGFDLVDFAR